LYLISGTKASFNKLGLNISLEKPSTGPQTIFLLGVSIQKVEKKKKEKKEILQKKRCPNRKSGEGLRWRIWEVWGVLLCRKGIEIGFEQQIRWGSAALGF